MVNISLADSIIVLIYICFVFIVGIYAWYSQRNINTKKEAESYFLASRNTFWIPIGFTLFSSNIGAEHFIGLAGTAANTGIAVSQFEWAAPFLLFMLGYFVSDIYLKANIVTTPEYLELRYNRIIRIYNAIIMLFIFIFTAISATLYAGSVILEIVMGWNMWISSVVLIIATGIYVILGGLRAVIWTEIVQAIILIIGGLIVCGYSLNEIGGINKLRNEYNGTNKMHMARKWNDKDWPWPGVYLSIILGGYYYWNCNQMLVQRVLCAKNSIHAKYGCIMAAMLKILPVFMMVIPGMISVKLYGNQFIDEHGRVSNYDYAYPVLVIHLLPKGITGIVIASMLSALMSSLASVYNSASTIIVNDVYKIIYPDVNDHKLVKIGRISACIFIIISLVWLPIIKVRIHIYVHAFNCTNK